MQSAHSGKKIVIIDDIRFKGKRKIDWKDVEQYLKEYIGNCYEIIETSEKVYIGNEFPDEYTGSMDTHRLRGIQAKAKANATQGIPELLQIATNKRYKENLANKHHSNALYGWYRYHARFALPVYNDKNEAETYNIFLVEMLIRHASDNKLYLYDIVNIKKETSTPLKQ